MSCPLLFPTIGTPLSRQETITIQLILISDISYFFCLQTTVSSHYRSIATIISFEPFLRLTVKLALVSLVGVEKNMKDKHQFAVNSDLMALPIIYYFRIFCGKGNLSFWLQFVEEFMINGNCFCFVSENNIFVIAFLRCERTYVSNVNKELIQQMPIPNVFSNYLGMFTHL
jgi:hypothetical protein